MIWLTADEHYHHANIIEFCNRPFATLEEMDETLIERHNAVVKPGDLVWHLGDFAWNNALQYLKRLNGRHCLVMGNHDHKHLRAFERECFDSVVDVMKIKDNHRTIWASHYAHACWPGSYRGVPHAFGHSHGKFPGIGRSMDVGVDCQNFTPISFDDVLAACNAKVNLEL